MKSPFRQNQKNPINVYKSSGNRTQFFIVTIQALTITPKIFVINLCKMSFFFSNYIVIYTNKTFFLFLFSFSRKIFPQKQVYYLSIIVLEGIQLFSLSEYPFHFTNEFLPFLLIIFSIS